MWDFVVVLVAAAAAAAVVVVFFLSTHRVREGFVKYSHLWRSFGSDFECSVTEIGSALVVRPWKRSQFRVFG